MTPDGWHLGEFVARLRRASLAGALGPDHDAALDRGGLDRARDADGFAAGLDALRRYRVREGHTVVAVWHREDEFPLGEWRRAGSPSSSAAPCGASAGPSSSAWA